MSHEHASAPPLWRKLHPAWCGLLGFLLYLPTLSFGFVNYDDPWLIQNNALLHALGVDALRAVWLDLGWVTRRALGSEYLPVRDTAVMLDYALYGGWIGGHHLSNALVYGALCALFGWAVERWSGRRGLALAAGALFAAHPVHVEAVAWLSERKGLLAGVFVLLSALALERWRAQGGWWRWALAALALALAIWSKAMAVAGVGALAALLWLLPGPGEGRLPPRRVALGWVGLALVAAAAFWPGWHTGQSMQMVQGYHGGGVWATGRMMLEVHSLYVRQLMLVGGELGIRYPISAESPDAVGAISGAALLVAVFGLAAAGWWGRVQGRRVWAAEALGASWWLIWLAPVSQVLLPLQNVAADRYLLLPSAGWALLVAALGSRLQRARAREVLLVAACGAMLMLSALQTRHWASTEALYLQALQVHPGHGPHWSALAVDAVERGQPEAAWRYVSLGLEASPGDADLLHRRALLLQQAGRPEEALSGMREAAQAAPPPHVSQANLAILLARRGEVPEALVWAGRAVQGQGARVPHHQRALGIAALAASDFLLARRAFEAALALEPGSAQNHYNLGLAHLRGGEREAAVARFREAEALDPGFQNQIEAALRGP